jgi:hypothetical protein
MPDIAPWNPPSAPPVFERPSGDDLLWQVPVTLDELTSLIMDPQKWIKALNTKSPDDEFITLRKDFALRLQPWNGNSFNSPDNKPCLVQGICGTNVITVRRKVPLSPQTGSKWDEYWEQWENDGILQVTYNKDFGQGYAHLQLTSKLDTAATRADKIAAFLMLAADATKTRNGDLYINALLKKKPNFVAKVEGGVATSETPANQYFVPLTVEGLMKVNFTLVSNLDDLAGFADTTPVDEDDPPTLPACDNMAGTLVEQLILVDDIVIKNYVPR